MTSSNPENSFQKATTVLFYRLLFDETCKFTRNLMAHIVDIEEQGARSLMVRLLIRRCGELSVEHHAQVRALSLTQLEELGEALLDFTDIADFEQWLRSRSVADSESQSKS
jgi:hypothetical protein